MNEQTLSGSCAGSADTKNCGSAICRSFFMFMSFQKFLFLKFGYKLLSLYDLSRLNVYEINDSV